MIHGPRWVEVASHAQCRPRRGHQIGAHSKLAQLWVGLLIALATLMMAPAASAESRFCVPSKAARASLLQFERIVNECGREGHCWEKERAILEKALRTSPSDPHLHRAYQDIFTRWAPNDYEMNVPDFEQFYELLLAEDPDNPTYLYGAGRSAEDPAKALAFFEQGIRIAPAFPWNHVGLAYVSASDGEYRDLGKLKKHMGRFIEICPSRSKVALSYAPQIESPEFWQTYLPQLRQALSQEPIAGTFVHYAQIWQIELTYWPEGEHKRVKRRIARDLGRIEALDFWENEAWTATLLGGYGLLGKDEKVAQIEAEVARRQP